MDFWELRLIRGGHDGNADDGVNVFVKLMLAFTRTGRYFRNDSADGFVYQVVSYRFDALCDASRLPP